MRLEDVPEDFRQSVRNWIGQIDGLARQGLDLPAREGVEVDLEPGDTLQIAAHLMSPWLYEQRKLVSSEAKMAAGGALLVIDGLRDGGLERIMEAADGRTAAEEADSYEPPEGGEEVTDDF